MTWKQRLDRARTNGSFTITDECDARNWCQCVVSEVIKNHPDIKSNRVEMCKVLAYDKYACLYELGLDFMNAVVNGEVPRAWDLRTEIRAEARRLKLSFR